MRNSLLLKVAMAALLAPLALAPRAHAQCELAWDPQFPPPGANAEVTCSAVYDSGNGPELYVGGSFTMIAGINTFYIAKFDGETWSRVGGDFNDYPAAMAVYDDGNGSALYVAGGFTVIGGVPIQRFAKWNGTTWSVPAGGTFNVGPNFLYTSSALSGASRLYASGQFTTVNGNAIKGLAAYDGSSWSSVGGENFINGTRVIDFDDPSTPESDLFISGAIEPSGGGLTIGVFRFDGTSFHNIEPLGTGGNDVRALAAFDDGSGECLYVGGMFATFNGVAASRMAKWNGKTWSAVGGGLSSDVQYLARDIRVWDDGNGAALYACGKFQSAGGTPAGNIARWNGQSWSPLGSGLTGTTVDARLIIPFDPGAGEQLVVCGTFTGPVQNICSWSGQSWTSVGKQNGLPTGGSIKDFAVFNDPVIGPELIACGNFLNAGPSGARHIAGWNGHQWRKIGPGFSNNLTSLVVFDDGKGNGPNLYAGGASSLVDFSLQNLNGLARWDGTQWHAAYGASGPYLSAVDMIVHDDGGGDEICMTGSSVSMGIGAVARFDGTTLTQIGPAFNRETRCITVFDDGTGPALYVGCISSQPGAAANDNLMKWDGSAWVPVGGGLQHVSDFSTVYALQPFVHNGVPTLAVSGQFDGAGSVASKAIIFWDGTNWSAPPGPEQTSSIVAALGVHDDGTGPALYAVSVNTPATPFFDTIVKLTPTGWAPLAYGGPGGALTMASFDPDGGSSLYLGGTIAYYFTAPTQSIPDGEFKRSTGIARWHTCIDEPGFLAGPGNQSVPAATDVTLNVQASGGDLTYRWRRDGVPLNNNAQQSGVDTSRLTLYSVDSGDEGDYDVVITNVAGNATSDPGTLTVIEPCIGDIAGGKGGGGGNNTVDVTDLLAVITSWGACAVPCPPRCSADIVPDCVVDVSDLLAVITHWGACP